MASNLFISQKMPEWTFSSETQRCRQCETLPCFRGVSFLHPHGIYGRPRTESLPPQVLSQMETCLAWAGRPEHAGGQRRLATSSGWDPRLIHRKDAEPTAGVQLPRILNFSLDEVPASAAAERTASKRAAPRLGNPIASMKASFGSSSCRMHRQTALPSNARTNSPSYATPSCPASASPDKARWNAIPGRTHAEEARQSSCTQSATTSYGYGVGGYPGWCFQVSLLWNKSAYEQPFSAVSGMMT